MPERRLSASRPCAPAVTAVPGSLIATCGTGSGSSAVHVAVADAVGAACRPAPPRASATRVTAHTAYRRARGLPAAVEARFAGRIALPCGAIVAAPWRPTSQLRAERSAQRGLPSARDRRLLSARDRCRRHDKHQPKSTHPLGRVCGSGARSGDGARLPQRRESASRASLPRTRPLVRALSRLGALPAARRDTRDNAAVPGRRGSSPDMQAPRPRLSRRRRTLCGAPRAEVQEAGGRATRGLGCWWW
jgi:hypothetical protein